MSWIKQVFTDFQTVITAKFLNDLQDQIIADESTVSGMVKGVKGNSESSYRSGNVNITKANIGLGNVDNTSDANKPVSTAQQTALNGKVDKVTGKGLSTNDYTDADKQKVDDAALQSDLDDLSQRINDETTGLDTKAPVILETVSGAIASFSDGADNMPIKKLVATIEPVQDLHGYDHPWPAGGGKNLLPYERGTTNLNGITYTPQADGGLKVQGTLTSNSFYYFYTDLEGLHFTPGETYRFSLNDDAASGINMHLYVDGVSQKSDKNYTFEIPSTATKAYVRLRVTGTAGETSFDEVVYPMVMLASNEDTSWVPYSNICPISGWTELNGARTGKNIFGGNAMKEAILTNIRDSTADGSVVTYPASKARGAILFEGFQPNTQYTLLLNLRRTDTTVIGTRDINLAVKYTDGTETTLRVTHDGTGNRVNYKFLTDASKSVATFKGVYNSASTEIDTAMSGIFVGNVDWDDFEPYNDDSEAISVNWQSTAGEVYGGTLDVVSGKMRVTWGSFDIGNVVWNNDTANKRFFRQVNGIKLTTGPRRTRLLCPVYQSIHDGRSLGNTPDFSIYGAGTSEAIYIQESRYGTVAELQEANQGNIVVYPLAAPIEYQLTPQEVTTLLGTNHVWTDVGPVEVTYPADTKLFIEKLTQPTEDDMTADHAIASGTFFQLGNTLYLATAAIAAGATITPGTNATKLSLADALNQLNT